MTTNHQPAETPPPPEFANCSQAVNRVVEILEAINNDPKAFGKESRIGDPFPEEITAGLVPGRLYVLSAAPDALESMLLMNLAAYIGTSRTPSPVGVFTNGRSTLALLFGLMSHMSGTSLREFRAGTLTTTDWSRCLTTLVKLKDAPLFVAELPVVSSTAHLQAHIRRMTAETKITVAFVENAARRQNGALDADTVASLEQLAQELNIAIVAFAATGGKATTLSPNNQIDMPNARTAVVESERNCCVLCLPQRG